VLKSNRQERKDIHFNPKAIIERIGITTEEAYRLFMFVAKKRKLRRKGWILPQKVFNRWLRKPRHMYPYAREIIEGFSWIVNEEHIRKNLDAWIAGQKFFDIETYRESWKKYGVTPPDEDPFFFPIEFT
jgi:hypothetical protein